MQALNVDGIKFGYKKIILPITKLVPRDIPAIWYAAATHLYIMSCWLLHFKLCCCVFLLEIATYSYQFS